ncbi:protein of unknown function [Burkholderia multivorans]
MSLNPLQTPDAHSIHESGRIIRRADLMKINECGKSSLQKSSCVGLSRAGLSHWRKDRRRHSPHCVRYATQVAYGHPASGKGLLHGLSIDARAARRASAPDTKPRRPRGASPYPIKTGNRGPA